MSNFGIQFRKYLPWFLLAELISYLGYYWPSVNTVGFLLCALAAVYFAYKNFDYLLALLIAELIIGSKGHLFALPIGDFELSVRMMLWLVVVLSWLIISSIKLFKSDNKQALATEIFFPRSVRLFLPLLFFAGLGLLIGFLNGNSLNNIYADGNAWLYFLLIWPFSAALKDLERGKKEFYSGVLLTAVAWLVIKTWIILYFFSHEFIIIGDFYKWIRDTGVGEITAMSGSFYRIFIQSHIYILMALVIAWFYLAKGIFESQNFRNLINQNYFIRLFIVSSSFLTIIIIGLSRSFWVGLFIALVSLSLIFLLNRRMNFMAKVKKYAFFAATLTVSFFLSLFIILLIIKIPFPKNISYFDATAVLTERVTDSNEAAIGSRWAMLPILGQAIEKDPLFGHGFGTTLTYKSEDPRIVAATGGFYTTFAFEWGWLDIWLKLGLFGLLAYFYLICELWVQAKNTPFAWPIRLLLVALVSLHIFTPYLNHPLGIGLILLVSFYELSFGGGLPRKARIWPNFKQYFMNKHFS